MRQDGDLGRREYRSFSRFNKIGWHRRAPEGLRRCWRVGGGGPSGDAVWVPEGNSWRDGGERRHTNYCPLCRRSGPRYGIDGYSGYSVLHWPCIVWAVAGIRIGGRYEVRVQSVGRTAARCVWIVDADLAATVPAQLFKQNRP